MEELCFSTAKPSDIYDIMRIELESFSKGIVEKESVFQERINVFPEGFLLLKRNSKTIRGKQSNEKNRFFYRT